MAQVITLKDDINGQITADVQTTTFSLNDKSYTLDLNAAHREELEDALRLFMDSAPLVKKLSNATVAKAGAQFDREELTKWAKKNLNVDIAARGRVKQEYVDQFLAAKK